MRRENVDRYIADFEQLAHRGGLGVNDRTTLLLFAQGLPWRLTESCIDHDSPETISAMG
jgi:hypothetical protein